MHISIINVDYSDRNRITADGPHVFASAHSERNGAEIYGLRKLRVRDMSVSSMRKYPEPFAVVNRKLSAVVRVCVKI